MLERAANFLRITDVRVRWTRARLPGAMVRRRASLQALLDLTARYLADPVATARLDPRSLAKLDRAFGRTQATLGWSRPEAIDYILATAARRMQGGGRRSMSTTPAAPVRTGWSPCSGRAWGCWDRARLRPPAVALWADRSARGPAEGSLPAVGLSGASDGGNRRRRGGPLCPTRRICPTSRSMPATICRRGRFC